MSIGRAETGIMLEAIYLLLVVLGGIVVHPLVSLYFTALTVFFDPIVALLFSLLLVSGFVLYASDRKRFLNHVKGNNSMSTFLTILGFLLIAESILSGISTFTWVMWYSMSAVRYETTVTYIVIFSLYLVLLLLPFISGVLLLADGSKIPEVSRALEQKIDFEEAWKKYPKDLFAEYNEKYPHNPEGVLEWHIHKKMKEGKTREQAIKELKET